MDAAERITTCTHLRHRFIAAPAVGWASRSSERRAKSADQSVRVSIGVVPNWLLNARVIELAFSYPHRAAISAMDRSVLSAKLLAAIRRLWR